MSTTRRGIILEDPAPVIDTADRTVTYAVQFSEADGTPTEQDVIIVAADGITQKTIQDRLDDEVIAKAQAEEALPSQATVDALGIGLSSIQTV